MSYLYQKFYLQDISLSTIGGPPDIDLMLNHLTSCILGAKNIAVPNVVPYRYKIKLSEVASDLIRFRNQCRRHWGRNKKRELKKFVNKLTTDILDFGFFQKAAGPDQINNRLIKKLPKKAIVYLTLALNTHIFQLPKSRQILFQF
jgi:hypothetical protein